MSTIHPAPVSIRRTGSPTPLTAAQPTPVSPAPDPHPLVQRVEATSHVPIAPGSLKYLIPPEAVAAIDHLAAAEAAGPAVGGYTLQAGGVFRRFENGTIYWSAATGAHLISGEILEKYLVFGGPAGELGFPLEDVQGSPDRRGHYAGFQGGSIYTSPETGPKMVRGAIRDVWAGTGWERGPLGYPVVDEYTMYKGGNLGQGSTRWSMFENGAILSSTDGAAQALAAELAPADLRTLVWRTVAAQLAASPENVGLHPQIDDLGVTDWTSSLGASGTRHVSVRLYGFRDNGLIAPDAEFTIELELSFGLVWPNEFGEPGTKTLVAGLDRLFVHASGIGNEQVKDGLFDQIWASFYPAGGGGSDPARPWVTSGWRTVDDLPTGSNSDGSSVDMIGFLVTSDGGLQVLLNPLPTPAGGFRKVVAQRKIDALLQG